MLRSPFLGLLLVVYLFGLAVGPSAKAQSSSNLQYQVANLIADVRMLDERLRQMTNELEEMRRENRRLRELVDSYEQSADGKLARFVTADQLNASIRQAVAALEKRDEVLKKEVIEEVGKTIEAFASKVNKALGAIPQIEKPDPNIKTSFSLEGVPSEGVPYTVAPGDTLAGIAKKMNSRMDWIQNANKISDPRLLQVGQVILVPQEK
ncbi:LysM domain-containing protein [Pelagicoccus sp. SDUM812003]|uniref:LysM peptidoglycan-binding domain-containing protein n=1 Tax=Pelagicoccus sp. SDUM812003 TaxID=3041267 RepID=UPI00280ECB60|nr:LysM domain-containing protein [Pelagicoccus sp. SDUM812003]MDQ8202875.1 LysM domain-containing protein [Pelagicoccus sp. SDUM812003]